MVFRSVYSSWSVCDPANISVPKEGYNVRKVNSKLERNDIEVDKLSSRPEFVEPQEHIEVFLCVCVCVQ